MRTALARRSMGDGRAILVLGGKELQVLVRLTRTAKVAFFQRRECKERESGLMFGREGRGRHHSTAAWLRTIVEYEQVLPRVARCVQQKIRLDEVAWPQWRRLAFGILKFQWGGGKKCVRK